MASKTNDQDIAPVESLGDKSDENLKPHAGGSYAMQESGKRVLKSTTLPRVGTYRVKRSEGK
jgi:hypothetical protein